MESHQDSTGLKNNYQVTIGRETFKNIKQVAGLESEVEVVLLDDGGSSDGQKNVRGASSNSGYLTLTVESTSPSAFTLWDWYEKICDTSIPLEKRNIKIELLTSDTKKASLVWKISNAWPCRWIGPELNKNDKGVSLDSIAFSFETIKREKGNA
jgi:phage tail-like protein